MNIDKIIAGPDPVADREVLDANNAEAEDTYAKVMARVAGRKVTNPRVRRRVFAGTGVFATAAAVVTMVAVSFGSVGPAIPAAGAAVLNQLAAHIKANVTMPLPGDATLVLRTQSYPDGTSSSEADLYDDNGEYFSTPSESGLPAAIAEAMAHRPALLDVIVTPEAISADGKSGLAWVPDLQPLAAWDEAERTYRESCSSR